MAESACLVRSFSQPSEISCHGANEGDPVRALTESISFGRFVSESLAWEKFSTFSHNRYLEEIEKFAKPGSVAQKKAFFEAHYKKRAAMKAAQKMLEEATVTEVRDTTMEVESASETQKDTAINSEAPVIMMMNTSEVIDEDRQVDVSSTEADCVVAMNSDSSISKMDEAATIVENPEVKDLNLENSKSVENLQQIENAENRLGIAGSDDKMQNEGNPASQGKERQVSSSLGSKGYGRRPRATISGGRGSDSLHKKSRSSTNLSSGKNNVGVSENQKRLMPASLHMKPGSNPDESGVSSSSGSMGCGDRRRPTFSGGRGSDSLHTKSGTNTNSSSEKSNVVSKNQKRSMPESFNKPIGPASSSSGILNKSLIWMPQNSPRSSISAKPIGESDKKKRSLPSSLHLSICVAPPHQTGRISRKMSISRADAKVAVEAEKNSGSILSSVHKSMNIASSTCQKDKTSQIKRTRNSTTREATSLKAETLPRSSGRTSGIQKSTLPRSSAHMSINLSSHVGRTSKTTPRTAKDDPNTANCSTMASMVGLSKNPLKNRLSEDKRKNVIVGSSISGTTLNTPKLQSSASWRNLLSPRKTYTGSSTVFTPFSFRSAERAEKRKEFFKKLEEKKKEKQAVKEQVPPPRSKIPLTLPRSPKPLANQIRISNNVISSHQRPRKSSSVINTISHEDAREKNNKHNKIHPSSTLLPKKKALENLSPNIQN